MEKDAAVRAQGALTRLRTAVERGEIRRAKREWGGANVLVCSIPRHTRHRELVTPHALEVSWMFESLRDAFSGLVDSCSKFELYGRLQLAATNAIRRQPQIDARGLCIALLDEAESILSEIRSGRFCYLSVAEGVMIARDLQRGDE